MKIKGLVFLLSVIFITACNDDNDEVRQTPPNATIYIESPQAKLDSLLELNTDYSFTYHTRNIVQQQNWRLEVFTKSGELIPVENFTGTDKDFAVSLPGIDVITNRSDYARTENGMLKAQVALSGLFGNGNAFTSTYAVALPYVPENPTLTYKILYDNFDEWWSNVLLEFSSTGVSSYLLTQQMIGDISLMLYPMPSTKNTFSLEGIFLDCAYQFKIKAINKYGESDYTTIIIGGDPTYYENINY